MVSIRLLRPCRSARLSIYEIARRPEQVLPDPEFAASALQLVSQPFRIRKSILQRLIAAAASLAKKLALSGTKRLAANI